MSSLELRAASLNKGTNNPGGQYVLYWMQASQRIIENPALDFAIKQANDLNIPLIVYFGITDNYLGANDRHYRFMLEGIKEVQQSLFERKIAMIIRVEEPAKGAAQMAKNAVAIVCDKGYLKNQIAWRKYLVNNVDIPCVEVESNVVVPAKVASSKEEYSAATFRPKIMKLLPHFLHKSIADEPKVSSLNLIDKTTNLTDISSIIRKLRIPHDVVPAASFKGGESEANRALDNFVSKNLEGYSRYKNDPAAYCVSGLSPYLHFGQISPVTIAQTVLESQPDKADRFLEELIVRRELAVNYVSNNTLYDDYDGLPEWARRSLVENTLSPKEYIYERNELEVFQTHDEFWNAAQKELVSTGKMHGYMRMYWGKKIIEWSKTPREAFNHCIYLNNKYAVDGRDPNSYAGIAWCFGKHDRPFPKRPIFGNVRYMSANGLRKKFEMKEYLRRVQHGYKEYTE